MQLFAEHSKGVLIMNWEDEWLQRREQWEVKKGDARDPYEVDYSRVVHSASFRRLQGKTQILNLGDSDFYRTRLTHSMEVSQVSCGIVQSLAKSAQSEDSKKYLPSQTLMQTICLVHDLGHPPFGHGGEVALNYCMREHGGFEGNGQTLRILSKLERYSKDNGSNLTRRTYLGSLKYPAPYRLVVGDKKPSLSENSGGHHFLDNDACKPPKCYLDTEEDVVKWLLEHISARDRANFTLIENNKTKYKSFDCSIMNLGDDISYGVHDLEDVITLGLVKEKQFLELILESKTQDHFVSFLKGQYADEFGLEVFEGFVKKLFSEDGRVRKQQISRLIRYFIASVHMQTSPNTFSEPLLSRNAVMRAEPQRFLDSLQGFVVKWVIKNPSVQHLEFKGQQMVVSVFEALAHDPKRLLPRDARKEYDNSPDCMRMRVICDFVSGMTDSFLLKTYDRLFSPRMGSVFDKL